uniref:Peptidyl-prolyl cis-trans isomerase n=1 Tax=Compsopogon caeruleus TaxID=31354 RepID=A0A7S1TIL1_9RHOD|mmetsp:Transcript_8224/g.16635  ORF Transcript_8224/g.16635 Transcript_8224/m.16635 type:complete len:197 (+) Transcript_8224:103-693(+)
MSTNPFALFDTSEGSFKAEIFLDKMPLTASNFLDLVKLGFYDGQHIHRVIQGFMVQFGCPYSREVTDVRKGTGRAPPKSRFAMPDGKKTKRDDNGFIPDEFTVNLANIPGTLAMANENEPNTGSSQFFINLAYNNFLNHWVDVDEDGEPCQDQKHPVFGYVVDGWDVILKIARTRVTVPDDYPAIPILVHKVTIIK